jgi:hypothetical protein
MDGSQRTVVDRKVNIVPTECWSRRPPAKGHRAERFVSISLVVTEVGPGKPIRG